jgi:cell division protease FtsH
MSWAIGYVSYQEKDGNDIGMTREEMLEGICVGLGGMEAERLLQGDISTGAGGSDLVRATATARGMVEYYGMGGDSGVRQYSFIKEGQLIRDREMSEEQRAMLDRQVNEVIREAQARAAKILKENRPILEMLRDMLLEKKTIDAKTFKAMMGEKAEKKNARVRPESRKAKAES